MSLLSHYTSESGLLGIAQSKALWATNFLNLNDTSEYFYAWGAIQKHALRNAFAAIPDDRKQPHFNVESHAAEANKKFRAHIQVMDGYGALYVTSFARPQNEDQNRRGILTLWDRYTKHTGFCLQFDRDDVRRLVEFESWRGNYSWLELADVKYGVDETAWDFKELSFQLEQRFRAELYRHSGDDRLQPQFDKLWADSGLFRKLMAYCARHKDPCFEDEREVRILAYPADISESRVFTGPALRKEIRRTVDGKKYIVIGEGFSPGFVPRRIIVGPKATLPKDELLNSYKMLPDIESANMPVA